MQPCQICGEPRATAVMCKPCHTSYLKYAFNTAAVIDAVVWAARRARRFERSRTKREKRRRLGLT